jgi:hypothetical protein
MPNCVKAGSSSTRSTAWSLRRLVPLACADGVEEDYPAKRRNDRWLKTSTWGFLHPVDYARNARLVNVGDTMWPGNHIAKPTRNVHFETRDANAVNTQCGQSLTTMR